MGQIYDIIKQRYFGDTIVTVREGDKQKDRTVTLGWDGERWAQPMLTPETLRKIAAWAENDKESL